MRTAALPVALVLVLPLAACGAPTSPAASPSASADASAEAGATTEPADAAVPADFCTAYAEVAERVASIEESGDWAVAIANVVSLAGDAGTVSPPAPLAEDWAVVTAFAVAVEDHFGGVDTADEEALEAAMDAMPQDVIDSSDAAKASAIAVREHAETDCAGEVPVAAVPADVCELLTDSDLVGLLAAPPPGEGEDYGEGFKECTWVAQIVNDHGTHNEVWLSLLPIENLHSEYIEPSVELPHREYIGEDIPDGHVYDASIGIGRVSSDGHTVSFSHGDIGGLVAVRTGKGDNEAADVGGAVRLAETVLEILGS